MDNKIKFTLEGTPREIGAGLVEKLLLPACESASSQLSDDEICQMHIGAIAAMFLLAYPDLDELEITLLFKAVLLDLHEYRALRDELTH